MKHQEHIVCVKASHFADRKDGYADYTLKAEDLILGQRKQLEQDPSFRQVLAVSVFTHNGLVWAYRRASSGGESRLHGKVALAVGGHWDLEDVVFTNSVIDLEASLKTAIDRELAEEVKLDAKIIDSYPLDKVLCADKTEVDSVHAGFVTIFDLDSDALASAEEHLDTIGFVDPKALLDGDDELETWTEMICQRLVDNAESQQQATA